MGTSQPGGGPYSRHAHGVSAGVFRSPERDAADTPPNIFSRLPPRSPFIRIIAGEAVGSEIADKVIAGSQKFGWNPLSVL